MQKRQGGAETPLVAKGPLRAPRQHLKYTTCTLGMRSLAWWPLPPVPIAWVIHLELVSRSLPTLWGKRFYLQLTDVKTEAQKRLETTRGHTVSKWSLDSNLGLAIRKDQLFYTPPLPRPPSASQGVKGKWGEKNPTKSIL